MTPDPDLALVAGLGLVLLSTLSIVAAWADARRPVAGGIVLSVGLCLIVVAVLANPQGYGPSDLPRAVFNVLGRYVF